ncbi:unnamed protein product, partial [Didymodactylos carnosus]
MSHERLLHQSLSAATSPLTMSKSVENLEYRRRPLSSSTNRYMNGNDRNAKSRDSSPNDIFKPNERILRPKSLHIER